MKAQRGQAVHDTKKRKIGASKASGVDALAAARKQRAAAKLRRKRLAATGVFYTPPSQKAVKRIQRGRLSFKKQFTLPELLAMSCGQAWDLLVKLGFLQSTEGTPCSGCGCRLGKPRPCRGSRHPVARCKRVACKKQVAVTASTWADHSVPLQNLAAVAWVASGQLNAQVYQDDAAQLTGVAHRTCAEVMQSLHRAIAQAGEEEQRDISLDGQCEADATTLRTVRLRNGRVKHVRVFGISKRGDHRKSALYMLPEYSTPPGGKTRPESIAETEPFIQRHTQEGSAIWHSDGARCYRHLQYQTRVNHKKKVWVAVRTLALRGGDVLVCYGGTQLQDGLTAHLKSSIANTMHTGHADDLQNLARRVAVRAWRYRRSHCQDMFAELGSSVSCVRRLGLLK